MKKKIINTAVFFTLLYWITVYFLVIKNEIIFKELTLIPLILIIVINLAIILLSRFLYPVFQLILKITQKIGNLIFGLITTIVYIFILTPIALFKRLFGKKIIEVGFENDKESYFIEWEPSANIEKQY